MPKAVPVKSTVTNGRLSKQATAVINSALTLYEGREVVVTISPPKRSLAANNYYHGVIIPEVQRVFVEAGYMMNHDDCHKWVKKEFLPQVPYDTPTGPETRLGSTANLDSTAFFDLVESIRTNELLLRMGFHVEDPEPSYKSYRIAA